MAPEWHARCHRVASALLQRLFQCVRADFCASIVFKKTEDLENVQLIWPLSVAPLLFGTQSAIPTLVTVGVQNLGIANVHPTEFA